jgi:hypothetical protein
VLTVQPAAVAVEMYDDDRASDDESGETVDDPNFSKIRGPVVCTSKIASVKAALTGRFRRATVSLTPESISTVE